MKKIEELAYPYARGFASALELREARTIHAACEADAEFAETVLKLAADALRDSLELLGDLRGGTIPEIHAAEVAEAAKFAAETGARLINEALDGFALDTYAGDPGAEGQAAAALESGGDRARAAELDLAEEAAAEGYNSDCEDFMFWAQGLVDTGKIPAGAVREIDSGLAIAVASRTFANHLIELGARDGIDAAFLVTGPVGQTDGAEEWVVMAG